jgi:hypothetical protein
VIVYVPVVAAALTVNVVPVREPVPEIVHTAPTAIMFVGVLEIDLHGPASAVKNPEPEIVTAVPTGPELGVKVMAGPVTMKLAVAKSPSKPVTLMVYVPSVAGAPATVNTAVLS